MRKGFANGYSVMGRLPLPNYRPAVLGPFTALAPFRTLGSEENPGEIPQRLLYEPYAEALLQAQARVNAVLTPEEAYESADFGEISK